MNQVNQSGNPVKKGPAPEEWVKELQTKLNELTKLNVKNIFGLSSQTTDYQKEMATRLHLPYSILSDEKLKFANALKLPTFKIDNMNLIKRITLILDNNRIIKYFYPVFPPDENVNLVIAWLKKNFNLTK